MKIGDLVKRKKIYSAIDKMTTPMISHEEIAIILEVKKLEQSFTTDDGSPLPKANLIKVIFPKTNKIHVFPEHYLELVSGGTNE